MMAQAKTKGVRHAGRREPRAKVDQGEGGTTQAPRGEDPEGTQQEAARPGEEGVARERVDRLPKPRSNSKRAEGAETTEGDSISEGLKTLSQT